MQKEEVPESTKQLTRVFKVTSLLGNLGLATQWSTLSHIGQSANSRLGSGDAVVIHNPISAMMKTCPKQWVRNIQSIIHLMGRRRGKNVFAHKIVTMVPDLVREET